MNLLPAPTEIRYSDKELACFARKTSQLTAIERGDMCCNCGKDCDQEGFHPHTWVAVRVNGHPFCGRAKCYDARFDEFSGQRSACSCGKRQNKSAIRQSFA